MSIFQDGDGIWGHCPTCGFAGDGLTMLGMRYGTKTLDATLAHLDKTNIIKREEIPEKLLVNRERGRIVYESLGDFISTSGENVRNMHMDYRLCGALGVPKSGHPDWFDNFGKFLGCADKDQVARWLQTKTPGGKSAAVIPYFDLPGRPTSFRLLGLYRGKLQHRDVFAGPNKTGGLYMLNDLKPNTEFVFAVEDPLIALAIQHASLSSLGKPFPVVAYQPGMTKSWPVFSPQLIFWGNVPTPDLFKQAKSVSGSRVSIAQDRNECAQLIHNGEVQRWLDTSIRSSLPWAEAMKQSLLSVSPMESIAFAADSGLTSGEAREVLFYCTSAEKTILSPILNLDAIDRFEIVAGKRVSKRSDGWWEIGAGHKAIKATNFTFNILESIYYNELGGYVKGDVQLGDKVSRFLAPTDELSKDANRWFREFTMKTGMGMSHTSKPWSRYLLDLATAFSDPNAPHSVLSAKVGWSADNTKFNLPGVTVYEGVTRSDMAELPPDKTLPVHLDSLTEWTQEQWQIAMDQSCIGFWSLFNCVAVQLTAKLLRTPNSCSTLIVGGEATVPIFCRQLGIEPIAVTKLTDNINRQLINNIHDIPAIVSTMPKTGKIENWLSSLETSNTVISVDRVNACRQFGQGWRFVSLPTQHARYPNYQWLGRALLYFIRALQTGKVSEENLKKQPVKGPISFFADWLESTYSVKADVIRDAAKLITHGALYANMPANVQCMFSLFDMILEGAVDVGLNGKKRTVTVGAKQVDITLAHAAIADIPWKNVSGLPVINIPRNVWDDTYDKWHKLKK